MGDYVVDILVENQIVLELKSVDEIEPIHEAQLINLFESSTGSPDGPAH